MFKWSKQIKHQKYFRFLRQQHMKNNDNYRLKALQKIERCANKYFSIFFSFTGGKSLDKQFIHSDQLSKSTSITTSSSPSTCYFLIDLI